MKKIASIIIGCVASLVAVAQPQFKAEASQLRLGEIVFNTPKTVTFSVHNTGNSNLIIKEVHPSCGCVKVDVPTRSLLPGNTGQIVAVYDAKVMGTFYRELAVYTNAQEEPFYLSFDGRVVETPAVFTSDLPVDMGDLKLSSNVIEFDDVHKGDKPVAELQVANLSHYPYTPQLMHLPPYLSAEYYPEVIPQGQSGRIRLTLDSSKLLLNGLSQANIYLARRLGDRVCDENEIVVSAVLLPAFRDLTPEKLATAPHLVLMDADEMLDDEVTFVPQDNKKKLVKVLNLTNIGEEPLTVSTVQVWNRAIGVSLSDRVIAPHGTAKLKITVDTKVLPKTKGRPRVLIISDDPRQSKTVLNIIVNQQATKSAEKWSIQKTMKRIKGWRSTKE
ncbi:MAG: DUF1573 domain-containing protein [Bacteroidaceae bacterium]|nr:DUF1573 domain-containing protein [Bacteroidaceae bacterium]